MTGESPIKQLGTIHLENWTHLAHGLRSRLRPDGTWRIEPVGEKRGILLKDIDPERFGNLIVQMRLLIVGMESFDMATNERIEWMPAASFEAAGEFGERPERLWRQISHRAAKNLNERAEHLSEAIAFHYLSAEISLRRISEGYFHFQSHVHKNQTPIGNKVSTSSIFEINSDIHAFFANLGSLRDYLASYVAEIILDIGTVNNHSALLKKIKNGEEEIEKYISSISDRTYAPIGVAHIGEYRDILIHRSPVGKFNDSWVETVELRPPLPKGSAGVTLQLPGDPFNLEGQKIDVLVLAHNALLLMAKYCLTVGKKSPIKPYMPHFIVENGEMVEKSSD